MRFLFLHLISLLCLASCAQNKKLIKESHAFFKQSFAGARLVTDNINGKEIEPTPDTVHIIYLKIAKSRGMPSLDTVLIGQKSYKAVINLVNEKDSIIGRTRRENRIVRFNFSKDANWWQLILIPEQVSEKSTTSKIITIKGRTKKQPFQLVIKKEIELDPDVRM